MPTEIVKKVNSKNKGARGELELCKLLTARFNKPFSRAVGSGARWAQVEGMSQAAKNTLSGDVTCPDHFCWCIECKVGYPDVDLGTLTPSKRLDSFLAQAQTDAARASRKPLLAFRQSRRPWAAFVPSGALVGVHELPNHALVYEGWTGVPLEKLLDLPDQFWFD